MRTKGPPWQRPLLLAAVPVAIIVMAAAAYLTANRQQEAARDVEFRNVQQAVYLLMADNQITTFPNPVTLPTNDMGLFPDALTSPEAKGLLPGDKPGYVLHGHDRTPDGRLGPLEDYVSSPHTKWLYTVTREGEVLQSGEALSD